MSRRARTMQGKINVGCIVWLAILGLVGYTLAKIVPVKIATSTFYDTMQEQASFGSIKGQDQIAYAILQKARELELPVGKENLVIRKSKEAITIEAHYEITIDFFNGVYKYVWKFDPVVSRPLFAV
jgi:type III secretion system FlhB-like substrate exporter